MVITLRPLAVFADDGIPVATRTQRTTSLSLNTWTSGGTAWVQEGETSIYTYQDSTALTQGWKWQYDRNGTAGYILTLDSVDFSVADNSAITFYDTVDSPAPNISVNLLGNNKVVSTKQSTGNYDASGIYFKSYSTKAKPTYTFEGGGSLNMSGYCNGICVDGIGDLIIKDTTIVSDALQQSAIYTSSGNVTIENSNITASAGGGLNACVIGVAQSGDLAVTNSTVFVSLKEGANGKLALCGDNVNITSSSNITVDGITIAPQNIDKDSKLFTINGGALTVTGSFSMELTGSDFVSSMINTSGMNVVTDPVGGKLLSRTMDYGKTIVKYAIGTELKEDLSNACTKVSFTKSPLPPSSGGYIPPVEIEKVPELIVDKDGNITATDKYGNQVKEEFFVSDGKTYYFDKDGNNVTGLNDIEDEKYFFNKDGTMTKSKFVSVSKKVNNKNIKQTYYFDKNGKALTGLRSIKKVKYFFDANGVMTKSSFVPMLNEIDGKQIRQLYYFDKNGKSLTGVRTIKNEKYHFNSDGVMTRSKFVTVSKEINGKKVKQTFYFNKNGKALVGKRTIGGKTYTFNQSGMLLK